MDHETSPTPFGSIREDIDRLTRITEEKIQAVVARDPTRLVGLLQEEIDPLVRLNRAAWSLMDWPADEKAATRRLVEHWAQRERYLSELLQTQLGYLDFIQGLLGPRSPALDLDL